MSQESRKKTKSILAEVSKWLGWVILAIEKISELI